jgi:ABC-type polysaccharide/polyol phosphate export permease
MKSPAMRANTVPLYDSDQARVTIAREFRDLIRYRDLLRLLVSRTIKSRYKRSVLGVAWTLLNPIISMAVLAIAFSTLFGAARPRYPVYLLAGLIVWNFFSQSTAFAMGQLHWGANLAKTVYVPSTIFVLACIVNGLVNIALSLVPLIIIMLVLGQPLYSTWWFFPLGVAIVAVFTFGVALLMSSLGVLFADFREMYQLSLQAWFFLTPIIYPREIIPDHFAWALTLNPMAYMVEIVRLPIYAGELPDVATLLTAVVLAGGALLLGAWVFTSKADELAYRV